MISFPGVSSLETPRRSAWRRHQTAPGPGQPPQPLGLGGVPGALRSSPPCRAPPLPALEIPGWRFPARGGSEFPWPPSGSVNFSPSSSVHICARSVEQPSARVGAGRSRPYLPRALWEPTGASTPRGTQGQVESEVCLAARVGRGLFAAPQCVCASFCA